MFSNFSKELKFYPPKREKVKWKVPGLFEHDNIIWLLHDLCNELKIRQPIHTVYGGIASFWSGGRQHQIDTITEKELYKIIEEYNSRNIACNITFSNYRIEKEQLDDYTGNLVCKVLNNINRDNTLCPNGIIISSDSLSDYIKEKYPELKQISSVIRPHYEYPDYNEFPEYYNKLCEKYDKVCIRPEFNTNIKFLKNLKNKEKIELLVNQICFQKCSLAQIHYDKAIQYIPKDNEIKQRIKFCNKKVNNIHTIYQRVNNSNEQIDKMVKLGFLNFKLSGRGVYPKTLLMSIIGRYIFHPTGYWAIIEDYILNKLGIP